MKERPILFSGEMVRAILDGRKTQTRRVIKPQPELFRGQGRYEDFYGWQKSKNVFLDSIHSRFAEYCPYGAPGDLLWVREAHGIQLEPCKDYPNGYVIYKADLPDDSSFDYVGGGSAWRPSIHMPRWASRITLEIISVRVERVQDIGEDDVLAEGVDLAYWGNNYDWPKTAGFAELWDSINDARGFGWDANPWVWVIEFSADNAEGK